MRMLDNYFFYDDYRWVWAARTIFNLQTIFTTSLYNFYRPVVCLAFWLNERAFGIDPFSYNLVNLVLHLINSALIYVLVTRLTRESLLAWLTALLFAGGFENYGAIVWISGRTSLIGFFFLALGLLASLEFFRSGRVRYYVTLATCFTISIFAKETAFSFILLFPLFYLVVPDRRRFTPFQWVLIMVPLVVAVVGNFYSRMGIAGRASPWGIETEYLLPNFAAGMIKPMIHPLLQRGSMWPRLLFFGLFAVCLYRGRSQLAAGGGRVGEARILLLALILGAVSALPTVLLAYNFFDLISIQQTRYHYFPSVGGALAYALIFSRWIRTGFLPPGAGGRPETGGGSEQAGKGDRAGTGFTPRKALLVALVLFSITLAWEYTHFLFRILRYATGTALFESSVRFVLRGLLWAGLAGFCYAGLYGAGSDAFRRRFREAGGALFVLLLAARMLQGYYVETKHDRNARVHKYVISVLWDSEDLDENSEVYVQQHFMGPNEYASGVAMEGYPWRVYAVRELPEQIRAREPGLRYFYCVIDEKGARLTEYPPIE